MRPDITLLPMTEDDLPFVHAVRNDETTRRWLHHDQAFSLDDMRRWYFDERPRWLVVRNSQGLRTGYVRTSHWDLQAASVCVGCDIHPEFRRQGYAGVAYETLIEQLFSSGWFRIWLEVLPDNDHAKELYRALGFQEEGRKRSALVRKGRRIDSLVYSLLRTDWYTDRNVKVIVTYLGDRRARPTNATETLRLLQYLVECERRVDPGVPMDTLLVYNRFDPAVACSEPAGVARAEDYLKEIDGMQTCRGHLKVIVRNNVGLSFGGYSAAFEQARNDYDYWLFTEDDNVMVRDGYYRQAVNQLLGDVNVGYVALVGVSKESWYPTHCHGGVGCTRRRTLNRVWESERCDEYPLGRLPFHVGIGYDQQEHLGEIRFTNAIAQLGYRLVELEMEEVTVCWGDPGRRTSRMTPWIDPGECPDPQWAAARACHRAGRSLKIICAYLGDRRGSPANSAEWLDLFNRLVDLECHVDPGVPMDTLIVHNRPRSMDRIGNVDAYEQSLAYLASLDGMQTRRGTMRVAHRENYGHSFGAFN